MDSIQPFVAIFALVPAGMGTLTAIAILIGGYVLIWGVWKKLDQVAGQVGNIVSATTGRLQKGLANYRQNQLKQRGQLWKQGGLFSQNSMFAGLNDVGRRVGAAQALNATRGGGGLRQAFFGRDRNALLSNYDQVVRTQKENDPMLKALANFDQANAVLAGTGGVNTDQALARAAANAGLSGDVAASAISAARVLGVNRANAMTALRTAMQNKARGVSAGNVRFLDGAVRALSGNEAEYQGLAQEAAFFARSNGRADLGGTHWVSWQTDGEGAAKPWRDARAAVEAEVGRRTEARRRGSTDVGDQAMTPQQQETLMYQKLTDANIMNGVERIGIQAMVAGHDNQVVQVLDTLQRQLELSSDPHTKLQAAIALKEIQGNMPAGASGSVRDAINRVLYNAADDATRPGLGLNASGNIAQQLAVRAGIRDAVDPTTGRVIPGSAGQTLTTMGRTYGEYTVTNPDDIARRREMTGG